MDPSGCPDRLELSDFLLGKLTRERTAWIAAHAETCAACESLLQELEVVSDPLIAALSGSTVRDTAPDRVPERLIELAKSAHHLPPPDRLGRFQALEKIGEGSYGTVFKAKDGELGRTVAIKLLRANRLTDRDDLDRFLREARSFAHLKHPGIVTLYEIGQENNQYYFVEEYVEGVTLAERLAGEARPFRESAELAARVCDALEYAHRHGVIHRDIKPSNILLDSEGFPHLTDFGLAKWEGEEKPVTRSGEVLGTPAYMSPEQARGDSVHVDARSDVYSVGVILYELLAQERPFQGNRRMLLLQVLEDEPRPPRQLNERIPRDLETICLKAMSKGSAQRYSTAQELGEDLRRFLSGEPILARAPTAWERLVGWTRRRPVAAAVAAVVFAASGLLAATFAMSYVRIDRERTQTRQALFRETRAKEELFKALVQNARLTSDALKECNDYYSEVIGRLTDRTIQVTHDYAARPNAIPLPATMSVELAERLSQKSSGMKIRLYSDLPFPWRKKEGGPKDDFEAEALRQLRSLPDRPYYRLEDLKGHLSLRYATASRMEKRCVDCHNSHKESPKKDWKEGEVVGAYEVSFPVETFGR